jgi:hypothetical protein
MLGKLVPAVLAVASAIAAGVLQFERPHDRWRLYRGYQRAFEDKRLRYLNGLSPFDTQDAAIREQLFGEQVAALRLQLHNDWSGVLPAADSVLAALAGPPSANP